MAGLLDVLDPITRLLPEVRKPKQAPPLQEKLLWTGGVLLLYFVMGQVYPIGIDEQNVSQAFARLDILLGSRTGTLITAGIGPIVLASIFLQLAVGAGLLKMDMHQPDGRRRFQGLQKLLAIVLSFGEAFIYTFSGYLPVKAAAPLLGSLVATQLILAFQLALGSILLLYLDEVVQKYGIGQGISLFIAAGVSQAVFLGAFAFTTQGTDVPTGLIPQAIYFIATGDLVTAVWTLMPIVFTIAVFLTVVYVEGMKIELPLAYGMARGLGARYPIKFLYVSNMPVILASAVLLNVQLLGLFLFRAGITIFGNYQGNNPVDGLSYYLSGLPSPLAFTGGYPAYLQFIAQPTEILHIITYGIALVLLCILFGWFWIESTGMSARDVAGQLTRVGLQIPGYRQDPRVIEKILERYIPVITVLGSAFVGILAWFADITGALGTGTGILLTVGILYKFYEELAQQQLFEMYPALKNMGA